MHVRFQCLTEKYFQQQTKEKGKTTPININIENGEHTLNL